MGNEWKTVRVLDIADKVAMGPFGASIKVETFVPSGVPVISGQHLHGFRLDESPGYNFISEKHAEKLKNAIVKSGDIIFTHAGNIGQVCLIPENTLYERYIVSQRQFYLRCDRSKAIPEYVVTYFKSREGQHKLLANKSQVGVPSIAQPVTYLRTIEIPLPPIPEQKRIARIQGSLDDRIELNSKTNITLEVLAKVLFKSWFVDFEIVKAKATGRSTGLPPNIDDLFPDSFEDSELGLIPKNWRVGLLRTICTFEYGKALKKEVRVKGQIPVMGSNGQIGWHNEALVKGPGIIIGRKGNPGIVTWTHEDFYPIDTTFYLKTDLPLVFMYFLLQRQNMLSLSADSAVPGLNRDVAMSNKVVIPPRECIDRYNLTVAPFVLKTASLIKQSTDLSMLREILLQRLLKC